MPSPSQRAAGLRCNFSFGGMGHPHNQLKISQFPLSFSLGTVFSIHSKRMAVNQWGYIYLTINTKSPVVTVYSLSQAEIDDIVVMWVQEYLA